MTFMSFASRCLVAASCLTACSSNCIATGRACAPTPALALKVVTPSEGGGLQVSGTGYRIKAVQWDPLLHQRWAMISSCEYPERPPIALAIIEPLSSNSQMDPARSKHSPFLVVHAGDLLELWRQEPNLRITVAGRAEESGAEGGRVRVRLLHSGFDSGQEQTVIGFIHGPGDVEMER
jgi:hypothetical protein